MNKKSKEDAIEARLPDNPFLSTLVIPATSRLSFEEFLEADKEGFRGPKPQLLDRSPHVKFFLDSDALPVVNMLSECAKSLFIYILTQMRYAKDYVKIDAKAYGAVTGVRSRTTLAKAKSELYRLRFIEPTAVRSIYFINPAYFFCGSRTRKFRKNTKVTYTEKQL